MTTKEFLKKHKAWKKFVKNIRVLIPDDEAEDRLALVTNGQLAISNAFVWSDSEEGHDYWSNLDDKYSAILNAE